MIAACVRISSSMRSVSFTSAAYSASPKPVALYEGGHLPTVYECSESPSMFQLQTWLCQAFITASV